MRLNPPTSPLFFEVYMYKIGDAVRRLDKSGKGRVSMVCRVDPFEGTIYVNLLDQSDATSGCKVEDCELVTDPIGEPGFCGKPWTAEALKWARARAEIIAEAARKRETRWGRPPQLF